MTNTQHTPGPWTALGRDGYNSIIIRAEHASHWPALVPEFNEIARDPEQEANARLIAAAPDLIDALRDIVARIDCYDAGRCPPSLAERCREIALAAIAKAEGKQ